MDMTWRILVVDDEAVTGLMFKRVLELRLACTVDTAHNGQEALDKARALHPDLMLLDIRMPGMDGFQVCRALKSDPATADTKVVYVSGNAQPEGPLEGAQDYLIKPVPAAVLCDTVTRVLRG